jgi:molybdate transport system ATP-binding protein
MSLSVNIRKRLDNFQLNVRFEAGNETLALLGASGCGKSVTLRCIAGILKPDEGRIELDGQVLFDSAGHIDLPPQKRNVGYLFQQYALFPNMTVRQNIAVAVRDRTKQESVTEEKLQQFRLAEAADRRPRQLSGGQQQRTALARILASEPKAILLDEPFSALDSYLKYQLELELHDTLERFPGTVVWVSHDRGEVWRNCPRVCVMDHGHSEPVAAMAELFRHPGTESAARLSGCKNYIRVLPDGDRIQLPDWGVSLHCGAAVPDDVAIAGIRSHQVRIAAGTEENRIFCSVMRVVDDVFGTIVLLRPQNAADGAPLLRMELSKEAWAAQPDKSAVTVSVAPQDILLLK